MGKGDKRSKRGKLFKGSFGKSRPHKSKKKSAVTAAKPSAAAKKSAAPKIKSAPRKKKTEKKSS